GSGCERRATRPIRFAWLARPRSRGRRWRPDGGDTGPGTHPDGRPPPGGGPAHPGERYPSCLPRVNPLRAVRARPPARSAPIPPSRRDPPRVFATRDLPAALARLAPHCALEVWRGDGPPPPDALAAGVAEADGLLCLLVDRIDAALLARAPRLRAISSVSVGVDHIDLAAATARGIPVGHTPGVLTETTADLAFALLLAAARRVVEADAYVRAGRCRAWEPDLLLGRDVHGATLGLVGLGAS